MEHQFLLAHGGEVGIYLLVLVLMVGAFILLWKGLLSLLPVEIASAITLAVQVIALVLIVQSDLGITGGIVVLASSVVSVVWLIKFFPNSRLARRITSHGTIGDVGAAKPELMDQFGTALTTLRPTGMAQIAGHRVDVVTEGQMVEKGTPVRVIAVEGLRVVVRAEGAA